MENDTCKHQFLNIKFLQLDVANAAPSSKDMLQNLKGSSDYLWLFGHFKSNIKRHQNKQGHFSA